MSRNKLVLCVVTLVLTLACAGSGLTTPAPAQNGSPPETTREPAGIPSISLPVLQGPVPQPGEAITAANATLLQLVAIFECVP